MPKDRICPGRAKAGGPPGVSTGPRTFEQAGPAEPCSGHRSASVVSSVLGGVTKPLHVLPESRVPVPQGFRHIYLPNCVMWGWLWARWCRLSLPREANQAQRGPWAHGWGLAGWQPSCMQSPHASLGTGQGGPQVQTLPGPVRGTSALAGVCLSVSDNPCGDCDSSCACRGLS